MSELPEVSKGLVSKVAAKLAGVNAKEFKALDAEARKAHRKTAKDVLLVERRHLKREGVKAAGEGKAAKAKK